MAEFSPPYTPIHHPELDYSPWSVRLVHLPCAILDKKNSSSCRAYLRHGAHQSATRANILHTSTIAFFQEKNQDTTKPEVPSWSKLSQDTFNDILDAISYMDAIDGGITVLLRCPGGLPASAEGIIIDTLLPTALTSDSSDSPTPVLVQKFAQDIALPHLLHLRDSCRLTTVPIPCQFTNATRNTQSFRCRHFGESGQDWENLIATEGDSEDDSYENSCDEAWWAEASLYAISPGGESIGSATHNEADENTAMHLSVVNDSANLTSEEILELTNTPTSNLHFVKMLLQSTDDHGVQVAVEQWGLS